MPPPGRKPDARPPAAAPKKQQPPTWSEAWLWLEAQRSWRTAADIENVEEGRGAHYSRDIVIISRLLRLVDIVQLLGPQFIELLRKNKQMLSKLAMDMPIPPRPVEPVSGDGDDHDNAAHAIEANEDDA